MLAIYKKLEIKLIKFSKFKYIRDFNEKIVKKSITYIIYLDLVIQSHCKLFILILIADINYYNVIISKL